MNTTTPKRLLSLLLTLCMLAALVSACSDFWDELDDDPYAPSTTPSSSAVQTPLPPFSGNQRDYRVRPIGGGNDTVTLMFYLCGSDLETESGAATEDLWEIMQADISDKLNIVVETGGSYAWQNDYVDASTNERWLINNDGLNFLDDVGAKDMSRGSTLTDFIKFSAQNYPADRYMLVLWDHGGGTVDGYAYDERFGGGMMPISELSQAIANSGVVFDMIGFDCCLMSTVETAFMVEKYADYMVASQRVEPGEGWYYTPWIKALSANTSIPTLELGKIIVDSYIEESRYGYYGRELTLSVTDLTYITDMFESMYEFFSAKQGTLIDDGTFISTSHLLSGNRAITDNYDLVDLILLIENMGGSGELQANLKYCVAYNGTTIDSHNGLSLYFPYSNLRKVGDALDVFDEIGIAESYQSFITSFANIMVGGQVYSGGGSGGNPLGGDDFDFDYWLNLDWVDELFFGLFDDFYYDYSYDDSDLEIYLKDDEYVLSLSDDDWDIITDIVQWVYLDDGGGYIELGGDSMYEFNDDGDLIIAFDNTWVALDGQLVCFYTLAEFDDGNNWYTYGAVPIYYNNRDAELVLMWDNDNPYGYVAGWRYSDVGSSSQKGLFEIENGMRFDFVCEYYTYDGEYDGQYFWGDMTVRGAIEVSYEDVGDDDCLVFYELRDICGNSYWTEAVVYSMY